MFRLFMRWQRLRPRLRSAAKSVTVTDLSFDVRGRWKAPAAGPAGSASGPPAALERRGGGMLAQKRLWRLAGPRVADFSARWVTEVTLFPEARAVAKPAKTGRIG